MLYDLEVIIPSCTDNRGRANDHSSCEHSPFVTVYSNERVLKRSSHKCRQYYLERNCDHIIYSMTTVSPKQATLRMVRRLADNASFEDIQYELYVLQNIQEGLRDVEQGNTVSHEEARRQLCGWLDAGPTTEPSNG